MAPQILRPHRSSGPTDPFAGTQDLLDGAVDVLQGAGLPNGQYLEAVRLAESINDVITRSGGNLSFTGHSLGGGLAAAASLATGRSAVTFNAAGVSPVTRLLTGGFSGNDDLVTNYRVEGEILTLLQERIFIPSAVGIQLDIAPIERDRLLGSGQLHRISSVLNALDIGEQEPQ